MVTVLTRTIGPSGRDYASFTLAEADVENIGTSADLVANDEAIVFEADAGTYNEAVTFQSTLTTDATRNVTYKPAAGSEHGGVLDGGVLITQTSSPYGYTLRVNDNFTHLSGLGVQSIGTYRAIEATSHGYSIDSLVIEVDTVARYCLRADWSPSAIPSGAVNTISNNVFTNGFVSLYHRGGSAGVVFDLINNTHVGLVPARNWDIYHVVDTTYNLVNNLVLNPAVSGFGTWLDQGGGGVATITGSNNFGGSFGPFPASIQGSPYPITPSTAYDPGAGDFALYVGKNGALLDSPNNDVIGQGVGPSANSDVPTTDILGNARSGATANPGAFEVPQATATITKTIGPSGRDYTTFTLAEADVTNIGGSADLVYENERIVFEADAGTYTEVVTHTSTLITDATRNVTYRAAAGSEHGGLATAGVIRNGYINHSDTESYTVFEGLVFNIGSGVTAPCLDLGGDGVALRDCIFISGGNRGLVRCGLIHQCGQGDPAEFTNCVFDSTATASRACIETAGRTGGTFTNIINCTGTAHINKPFIESTNSGVTTQILNCLVLGVRSYTETTAATLTGGNNFGGATNPFPVAIQGSPYPITPTTSFSTPLGSGDYAVYMGATGALADVTGNDVWQQGVGPASNSDVPTTDINGVTRSGATCNPGAFEADGFVAPTVLTRTIGSGKDYSTFTLAEAAVTSIGSGTDLTFYNEAIVFEADAGTYDAAVSQVVFNSFGLVTDPTRNITYKAAAGAQHGGTLSAGVIISAATLVYDDFTTLEELVLFDASGAQHTAINGTEGITYRSCLAGNPAGNTCFDTNGSGSALYPTTYENCVGFGYSSAGQQRLWSLATYSGDLYAKIINCTCIADGRWTFADAGSLANTLQVEIVNFLSLGESLVFFGTYTDPSRTYTGSNNFGGTSGAFPVALQGSPYPITATTDTSPGAGDWAIYDASTGALVYDSDNDVLGKGIGPAGNSNVPSTDIVGTSRSGAFCDPGAFEVVPATFFISGGALSGGYVPVGTFDVVPDTFPEAIEEQQPHYKRQSHALHQGRLMSTSETASSSVMTRVWKLRYTNASASEYTRVLALYSDSKGGAEGLYWNNQNFTRGGPAETVIVRMAQGPLRVRRTSHGRYSFNVILEEMHIAP